MNSVQTFIGGNREAGLAYVVMLLTLVSAISLALSFMLRVGTETEAVMSRSTGMQAEYLAESAAAHAKWLLLNDQTFPPDEQIYYMHSFAGGRYGYKVRRHTDTTFASVSTVGVLGNDVVQQSYVLYVLPPAGAAGSVRLFYDSNVDAADTTPWYRTHDGTSWDAEAAAPSVQASMVSWLRVVASPSLADDEIILASANSLNDTHLAVYDGTTWGGEMTFAASGEDNYKSFGVAYESVSGQGLVLGRVGNTSIPGYTVWDFGVGWDKHTVNNAFNGVYDIDVGDIDGDGDLDIVGAAKRADDITWWENADGTGTSWVEHTVDGFFDGATSVYAADIDGDGDLDVIGGAETADDITWWENTNGVGTTWTEHVIDGAFDAPADVFAVDIDGDNDLDILGAGKNADQLVWWENTNGLGTAWTKNSVVGNWDQARAILAADIDGDTVLEIAGASKNADEIAWFKLTDGSTKVWLHNPPLPAPDTGGDDVRTFVMTPNPTSDEILAAIVDDVNGIYLYHWDGDAFTNLGQIESNAPVDNLQVVDIVYEQVSGDALIIWSDAGSSYPRYRIWDGAALSAEAALPYFGSGIKIIHAAADPTSDYIFVGASTQSFIPDLNVAVWDGDSSVDSRELETLLGSDTKQIFDVVWEDTGNDVLVVWARSSSTLKYMQWTKGTALSAASILDGPEFAANHSTMQAFSYGADDKIIVVVADASSNLYSTIWDGDAFEGVAPTLIKSVISNKDMMSFDAVAIP